MNEAIMICPSCGNRMNVVHSLAQRKDIPFRSPIKPIRYVCKCGNLVKL